MTNKIALFFFLFGVSFTVCSQTESSKVSRRPDIPGSFALELGFNRDLGAAEEFSLGFYGSRTVNIYYQYEFRILKSKFSFVPGIGLSLERFKFKNDQYVDYDTLSSNDLLMYSASQMGLPSIKKSQLITNYIDVPLELRFNTNPEDPARSFKISVGGRVGYMLDSFSKIKYSEDGQIKKIKNKDDWNLTKFRYGLSGRIGIGHFSFFCYYNLSPLFKEGKGVLEVTKEGLVPNVQTIRTRKDFNTITIGISLASF